MVEERLEKEHSRGGGARSKLQQQITNLEKVSPQNAEH
jgi:hypothetical protein